MEKKSTLMVMELKDAPFQQPRPGYRRKVLCDENTPADSLLSGFVVMDPGVELGLHYHEIEELQFIVYGDGTVGDIDGEEHPVGAGSFLYCPPGVNGAHSFKNTGDLPMAFIFIYPSPGGKRPSLTYVEKQG
ncbi:MAG: cupin domain-containing protein [Candidatus Bathyarchaeia archaeon]